MSERRRKGTRGKALGPEVRPHLQGPLGRGSVTGRPQDSKKSPGPQEDTGRRRADPETPPTGKRLCPDRAGHV